MKLKEARTNEELKFLYDTRILPEVDKYLTGNPPKTFKQHLEYISKVQLISKYILIAYDENDTKIGYSQLYDWEGPTIEVGFVVTPERQGCGYGKDLVKKTIEFCESEFPNKTIILYVKRENKRAIHVYEKSGFIYEKFPLENKEQIGMRYIRSLY